MKETPNNTQSGALASVPQKEKKKTIFYISSLVVTVSPSIYNSIHSIARHFKKPFSFPKEKEERSLYYCWLLYSEYGDINYTERVVDHQRR